MKDNYESVEAVTDTTSDQQFRAGSFYRAYGKRAFDILVAVLLLPLVVPVILVSCLLVRRDGGPGLFAHKRIGKGGTAYKCWKIRTMVVDAEAKLEAYLAANPAAAIEWNEKQKLADDPRITKVGKFLRKTSLDELPQIWNVLRGEMSLVGPRPYTECQQSIYEDAGGFAYTKMAPGITGPWQVDGRSSSLFVTRVRFDNTYYRNLSLLEDFRIILRTATVIIKPTGV